YTCKDCDKPFDVRASIAEYSEGLSPECPNCGSSKVARGFSVVNVLTALRDSWSKSAGCGPTGFS
ncbi:FmdB family zinc ribbon protein, partial [Gemmatimonadota bacterium]